jgi:hypothetical protein
MSGSMTSSKKVSSLEVIDDMVVRSIVSYFSGTINVDGIICDDINTETVETTELILDETPSNSNTITLQASVLTSGSYSLTLPTDDGLNTQIITTDGTGTLSWTTPVSEDEIPTPGEPNTSVQYNIDGEFTGDTNFKWEPSSNTLILGNSTSQSAIKCSGDLFYIYGRTILRFGQPISIPPTISLNTDSGTNYGNINLNAGRFHPGNPTGSKVGGNISLLAGASDISNGGSISIESGFGFPIPSGYGNVSIYTLGGLSIKSESTAVPLGRKAINTTGLNGVILDIEESNTSVGYSGLVNLDNVMHTSFAIPILYSNTSSTVGNTSTVYIDGEPTSTGNATVTNSYSLWVGSGKTKLDGTVFTPNISAGSANPVHINAGTGEILDSVSLRAYKQDEVEIENETGYDVEDVLKLKPKFFTWKETGIRDLGFVVEDAIEANDAFIYRDEILGVPKNVKDRSIIAGLVGIAKKHQMDIDVLKEQLNRVLRCLNLHP